MPQETVIARLVLVETISSWAELKEIEQALKDLWPTSRVFVGGLDDAFPISVQEWKDAGGIRADEIRQFLVRGLVKESREDAPLLVEGSPPKVAVLYVAYPIPDGIDVTSELSRIGDRIADVWPAFQIEFGTVHHPGLAQHVTRAHTVMEFVVEHRL